MDEQNTPRQSNPRRKKKSQLQIFKETYLPLVIGGIALLLVFVFIIGSIVRGVQRNRYEAKLNRDASLAAEALLQEKTQEARQLATQAKEMAAHYDYEGAVDLLGGFSGNLADFPELNQLYTQYKQEKDKLVKWVDTNNILSLSFQMLIADPNRAFQDARYGNSYNKNFVTTEEFTKILHQLYENNYILIRLSDLVIDGQVQELLLPKDKKPLLLIQTQVNYNTYMVDGDGDKLPDKDGDGFASRLIIDDNGNITCQMVDSAGQTQTGNYDLVPILNSFVTTHPDFSYKGAKAILALTGYDGLFGYRSNPAAESTFGADTYGNEISDATQMAEALRKDGYELACYTYDNAAYGQLENAKIQYDLNKWENEVVPILGDVDILVYARNSDISDSSAPYSGEKINTLLDAGFTKFLGFCNEGMPWLTEQDEYMRLGRILVTGENMKKTPDWFEGIFDVATVLDPTRPA